MLNGFIDGRVNLLCASILNLLCPAVEERLEVPRQRGATLGRGHLPGRYGGDTDLLIGVERPAQELLDRGFHAGRQFAGFSNGDILHGAGLTTIIVSIGPAPTGAGPTSLWRRREELARIQSRLD
jgi:hypothetical protein